MPFYLNIRAVITKPILVFICDPGVKVKKKHKDIFDNNHVFVLNQFVAIYLIIPSQSLSRNWIRPISNEIRAITVYPKDAPKPIIINQIPIFVNFP